MSDYEQSRYPRPTAIDTGGTSAFWLLVVVVALGALVLIMAVGSATVSDDAIDTTPIIAPAAPDLEGSASPTAATPE